MITIAGSPIKFFVDEKMGTALFLLVESKEYFQGLRTKKVEIDQGICDILNTHSWRGGVSGIMIKCEMCGAVFVRDGDEGYFLFDERPAFEAPMDVLSEYPVDCNSSVVKQII